MHRSGAAKLPGFPQALPKGLTWYFLREKTKNGMGTAERFNLSGFSRFINSVRGRAFRLVAGSGFLLAGLAYSHHPLGVASLIWSVFPLSAGLFDLCYISGALRGPWSGKAIRACQREG